MLRPIRQTQQVNNDYVTPYTQERGGLVCWGSASGCTIVEYKHDPSGMIPVGLQLNDIEHINFAREFHPQRIRNTDVAWGTVGIATQGDFETDWVHIVGTVQSGDHAYAGPSGTLTNSSSFGGIRVGRFLSGLTSDPHQVTFRGFGFSGEFIDPVTKLPVWENNPDDRTLVLVDGYIKVRILPEVIQRSQLDNGVGT